MLAAAALTPFLVASSNGDEPLFPGIEFPVGNFLGSVATGDLNGDGVTDLAITNPLSDDVSVLLGVGDGTFPVRSDYTAGNAPKSVATGDFNGDGFIDLATANFFSANVSVLLNQSISDAPPVNDDWSFTIFIADPDFKVNGTNAAATTQLDEQQLENTGSTVWWYFDADCHGTITIDTYGSNFDTQLHIYTGFELGFPNLIPVVDNNDMGGLQSEVTFAVTAGTCYEIRVGGFTNGGPTAEGNIVLNGTFVPALLGDVDLNGTVNLLDVDPFIDRISTGTFQAEADCNKDGAVNLLDVDFFIAILGGG